MSIFSGLFGSYNRPGPGVRPDEPRKKGFARLIEILGRDLWPFFKAGFLTLLGAVPFLVLMVMAIATHAVIFVLAAGIIGGMIAAPQMCGLADTVLRSLRDEPGYWWTTYRRAWKRNWKATLLPGMLCGLIFGMQIFTFFHVESMEITLVSVVIFIAGVLLSTGLFLYVFPQIALIDLPLLGILRNAVLLFLGFLPRSIGGIVVLAAYWGAFLLFFPLSLYILPFTNFWLPMVIAYLMIYPALEKSFNIESTIKKMREEQLDAANEEDSRM